MSARVRHLAACNAQRENEDKQAHQTSAAVPSNSPPTQHSGAVYAGVPGVRMNTLDAVPSCSRLSPLPLPLCGGRSCETEKSMRRVTPSPPVNMLSGFTSQWATPCQWQ